jgi:hypothetical protein
MTTYTVRTVGNPGLYRSLRESVASETRHRTVSGLIRRLRSINHQSEAWAQSMGRWGSVEIDVDGKPLDGADVFSLCEIVNEYRDSPRSGEAMAARILAA